MSLFALTILMAVVFAFYVVLCLIKFDYEDLTSISASSYLWEGKKRFIFFGWLALLAVLNWWQDMEIWGRIMSMGFTWAGLTINHRKSDLLFDEIHTIGTVGAIASAFAGLLFLHGIYVPAIVMGIGSVIIYRYIGNRILWIECLAFATVVCGLLIR